MGPIDIEGYPAVKKHLDYYLPEIKTRQDQGSTYYNMRNCAYHEQFNKKKAVFPFISQHPRFSYDLGLYYVEVTGYIMTGNNLKYLILVLNSRPGFYLYKNIYTSLTLGKRGVGYQKHSLEKFPIPKPSKNDLMVSRRLFSQMASLQERKIINEQKNQKRPSWNTV